MIELAQPTSRSWIEAACAAPDSILLDHAHCEKKAASTSLGFVFRYPGLPRIVSAMSRIAREELLHFERVLSLIRTRGHELERLAPSGYGAALYKRVRSFQPEKLVDELLVSALIEARSCERFGLLATGLRQLAETDREHRGLAAMADLYEELGPSEERHAALYVDLACTILDEEQVLARLRFLAAEEAEIIASPGAALRLHAG